MNAGLRARKRADLASITGAAVAGAAVGAWFADVIGSLALPMLAAGLFAHALGMTGRHRLDRQSGPLPAAWQWLYVVCWIVIVALAGLGAWNWFGGSR